MILDVERRTLEHGGATVNLRPSGAALLEAMAVAYPRHAAHAALIGALWGERDEPENSEGILKTQVCYLRRSVAEVGLLIGSKWGLGYVLSRPVTVNGGVPVVMPPRMVRDLRHLLTSHPDHKAADALLVRLDA